MTNRPFHWEVFSAAYPEAWSRIWQLVMVFDPTVDPNSLETVRSLAHYIEDLERDREELFALRSGDPR